MATPAPLGMEDRTIIGRQIEESSVKDNDDIYEGRQARLNINRYWKPQDKSGSWIQVTFTSPVIITGIRTQGAGSSDNTYVKKLKIADSAQIITDQSGNEMVRVSPT